MSIANGDEVAFEKSITDNSEPVLFQDKNYTFITDSTSNSGSFSSGQIQFDLSTLNSQSQWVNLSESVIEFPVKITAQINTAGTGTQTTASTAAALSVINKNGFHSWIDSCQLIINGQTVQSSQPYENVSAQFRILSTWSQDNLRKWGTTCGVALDDMTGNETSTSYSVTTGLNNATYSTVATNVKGLDVVNNQSSLANKGVVARAQLLNSDINPSSANVSTTILGATSLKSAGKSNVSVLSGGSNTANTYIYSQFVMATVRLRDICDIDQFPMVKNLKGYLYLNFNAAQVNLTGTAGSTAISAVNYTPLSGRTTPFLINNSATGLQLGQYATTAPIVSIVGTVDATTTGAQTNAGPLLTNARLIAPYYIANPKVDAALTKTQRFSTYEKIVNPITCAAAATVNYTITVGVQNPRKLILLPMYQNLGGTSNLGNPEISAFDSVPQTSSPFAYLQNLQVYLANSPAFQYPIMYDFEMWNSEISNTGGNGKLVNELTSGLLTEQLWEQNHRFYVVDLSRRLQSEDGASKSVQVTFTNASSTFALKVIAIVMYEKKWTINSATCQLSSS